MLELGCENATVGINGLTRPILCGEGPIYGNTQFFGENRMQTHFDVFIVKPHEELVLTSLSIFF